MDVKKRNSPVSMDAQLCSLEHVLITTGVNKAVFLIPEYQREYRWDKENVTQFVDDILTAFNNNTQISDTQLMSCTVYQKFIGTVILEKANRDIGIPAYNIIDGQQRTITFLLHCLVLLDITNEWLSNSEDLFAEDNANNLRNLRSRLVCILSETTMRDALTDNQVYPRLLRSECDSINLASGYIRDFKYESEIASMLYFSGLNFYIKGYKDSIPQKPTEKIKNQSDTNIKKNRKILQDRITAEFNRKDEHNIMLFICFCEFFLDSITVVKMLIEDDEDTGAVLDIFESLNSTGTPLTAMEIFRAVVLAQHRQETNGCDVLALMDDIRANLDRSKGSVVSGAQSAIRYFMLTGFGRYIKSSKTSDYRKAIETEYKATISSTETGLPTEHEFISLLSDVIATKTSLNWGASDTQKNNWLRLGLQLFSDSDTELGLPLLLFIENTFKMDASETELAIKALVSFFILWRLYTGGTGGIDKELASVIQNRGRFNGLMDKVTLSSFKDDLYAKLTEKIQGSANAEMNFKDAWLKGAQNFVYSNSSAVVRFTLLAYMEQNEILRSGGGYKGLNRKWLSYAKYTEDVTLAEIDHICPQNPSIIGDGGWSTTLSGKNDQNKKTVDTLGNLTLISKIGNTIKSNKSPYISQICYRALAAKNLAELDDFINGDSNFTKNALEYISEMERSDPHYFLEEFDNINLETWDIYKVNERTRMILDHVWDILYSWLSIEYTPT